MLAVLKGTIAIDHTSDQRIMVALVLDDVKKWQSWQSKGRVFCKTMPPKVSSALQRYSTAVGNLRKTQYDPGIGSSYGPPSYLGRRRRTRTMTMTVVMVMVLV